MRVLVVGANGQLGAGVCAELLRRGHQVRGSVRHPARGASLADRGVEVVAGDLVRDHDLRPALDGVEAVVLTANPVVPRAGDDPRAVERGMTQLVDDAAAAGVERFVLPSTPSGPVDARVPDVAARRRLEEHVDGAALDSAVLRFPPLMEVWLALVGSSIPLRGEPYATVGRPSPFLRRFRSATATLVEDRGLMLVPGSPQARHAFIAVPDVATVLAHAVEEPLATRRPVEVGGPEVLSWVQVAEIYSEVVGRRVRVVATPAAVYACAAMALRPWARVPASTLALNRFVGSVETVWGPGGPGLLDPDKMTTVRELLTAKAELPRTLPVVP